MTALPIEPWLKQIAAAMADRGVLVLEAEPGSGKSTRVPWYLCENLSLNGKKIIMLEPRRVAARSLATYMAAQLGEKPGQQIGYTIRHDKKVSAQTRLEIVTEGVLNRRLLKDPELSDTAIVIFDEFHERSLHADFGLALALYIRELLRPDLGIVIMSATLDQQAISCVLGQQSGKPATYITCPGRTFPVTEHYIAVDTNMSLARQMLPLVERALAIQSEDLLVFLPGQADIRQLESLLRDVSQNDHEIPPWDVCSLYGGLRQEDQDRALLPSLPGKRKIILATNIAETSLTIPGVGAVVDSGLEKQAQFDPASGMSRLITQKASLASVEQRKGRAGRLGPGYCIRPGNASSFLQRTDQITPGILVEDLAALTLDLAAWNITDVNELPWITAPPAVHVKQARSLLHQLGLLTEDNKLTERGESALHKPVHPRLAAMYLGASDLNDQALAADLAALLTERDIFHRQADLGADLSQRVLALNAYRKNRKSALQDYPLIRPMAEQVVLSSNQLMTQHPSGSGQISYDRIGYLLAHAYPDRVGCRRHELSSDYLLSNGKGASLAADDPLTREPWIVAAELTASGAGQRIYRACGINQSDAEQVLSQQIYQMENVNWDASKSAAIVSKSRFMGAIKLSSDEKRCNDPELIFTALKCFVQHQASSAQGLAFLPWSAGAENWLMRARWLSHQGKDWPDLSDQALVDSMDQWLRPFIAGIKVFKQLDLLSALRTLLSWEQQQELAKQAPQTFTAPSGKQIDIEYRSEAGPVVSVQLQELFGLEHSPLLAWGKASITFELLSPARRPIQVTSDLAGFWTGSYSEVKKDMKSRYPKHRWPDNPATEQPGRSIKVR